MDTAGKSISIRSGLGQDQPQLERIAAEAYQQYIPVMGKKPAPMLADYAAHLDRDTVYVALDGEILIGYAIIISKKDGWWLENIAVDPAHAGKGVGTALIARLEGDLARQTDYYQLYTNRLMLRNIDWYLRLGFIETGRRLEDGYERVFFRKTLARV
jgi:ribosomal protein S18 acetylase RimI-like enzyme